jgi:hypothetical protein
MFKLSFMRTRQLGIHVRFGGRRLRIAMRLFLIPLSIAVLRSDFEKLLDKLPITGELLLARFASGTHRMAPHRLPQMRAP